MGGHYRCVGSTFHPRLSALSLSGALNPNWTIAPTPKYNGVWVVTQDSLGHLWIGGEFKKLGTGWVPSSCGDTHPVSTGSVTATVRCALRLTDRSRSGKVRPTLLTDDAISRYPCAEPTDDLGHPSQNRRAGEGSRFICEVASNGPQRARCARVPGRARHLRRRPRGRRTAQRRRHHHRRHVVRTALPHAQRPRAPRGSWALVLERVRGGPPVLSQPRLVPARSVLAHHR